MGQPSPDAAADAERLRAYAEALADAIESTLPRWVERCVVERLDEAGQPTAPHRPAIAEAGVRAQAEVASEVRALLRLDIDEQWTTPLSLLRRAVAYPTAVLRRAGVPPVPRDDTLERLFPDDLYALTPASFADVDESLHEPGVAWGAAKAYVHLARRRVEGRR